MQESNLAWSFDQHHLYGHFLSTNFNDIPATRGGNTSTTYIDDDQHLMVWMRVGAHATVRKLYAIINTDIPAGGLPRLQYIMSQNLEVTCSCCLSYAVSYPV